MKNVVKVVGATSSEGIVLGTGSSVCQCIIYLICVYRAPAYNMFVYCYFFTYCLLLWRKYA